jgi:transposase-like protein
VPAAKYTPEQRAEALALYETHGPSAVTARFGIPKTTVASWAKNAGVRTVRTEATRAAVEAKVVDGKLRRANIMHRLYGQAEKILDDLEGSEFKTLVKGQGGADHEDVLDFVPPNDRKTLIQSVSTATASAAKLEDYDKASADQSSGAVSVIDKLMAGFASAYEAGK